MISDTSAGDFESVYSSDPSSSFSSSSSTAKRMPALEAESSNYKKPRTYLPNNLDLSTSSWVPDQLRQPQPSAIGYSNSNSQGFQNSQAPQQYQQYQQQYQQPYQNSTAKTSYNNNSNGNYGGGGNRGQTGYNTPFMSNGQPWVLNEKLFLPPVTNNMIVDPKLCYLSSFLTPTEMETPLKCIHVKVHKKQGVVTYPRKDGSGVVKIFNVVLMDEHGIDIKGKCFGNQSIENDFSAQLNLRLELGSWYQISNFKMEVGNTFSKKDSNHKFVMDFKQGVYIRKIDPPSNIAPPKLDYIKSLAEIPNYCKAEIAAKRIYFSQDNGKTFINKSIAFVAKVIKITGPELKSTGSFLTLVTFADDSKNMIDHEAWTKSGDDPSVQLGQVVVVESAQVVWKDKYTLSKASMTAVDPSDTNSDDEVIKRIQVWCLDASHDPNDYHNLSLYKANTTEQVIALAGTGPSSSSSQSTSAIAAANRLKFGIQDEKPLKYKCVPFDWLFKLKQDAILKLTEGKDLGLVIPAIGGNPQIIPQEYMEFIPKGAFRAVVSIQSIRNLWNKPKDDGNGNASLSKNVPTVIYPYCDCKKSLKLKLRIDDDGDLYCSGCKQKKNGNIEYTYSARIIVHDGTGGLEMQCFDCAGVIPNGLSAKEFLAKTKAAVQAVEVGSAGDDVGHELELIDHFNYDDDVIHSIDKVLQQEQKQCIVYFKVVEDANEGFKLRVESFEPFKPMDQLRLKLAALDL
jgi:hypothetical protein